MWICLKSIKKTKTHPKRPRIVRLKIKDHQDSKLKERRGQWFNDLVLQFPTSKKGRVWVRRLFKRETNHNKGLKKPLKGKIPKPPKTSGAEKQNNNKQVKKKTNKPKLPKKTNRKNKLLGFFQPLLLSPASAPRKVRLVSAFAS